MRMNFMGENEQRSSNVFWMNVNKYKAFRKGLSTLWFESICTVVNISVFILFFLFRIIPKLLTWMHPILCIYILMWKSMNIQITSIGETKQSHCRRTQMIWHKIESSNKKSNQIHQNKSCQRYKTSMCVCMDKSEYVSALNITNRKVTKSERKRIKEKESNFEVIVLSIQFDYMTSFFCLILFVFFARSGWPIENRCIYVRRKGWLKQIIQPTQHKKTNKQTN